MTKENEEEEKKMIYTSKSNDRDNDQSRQGKPMMTRKEEKKIFKGS